MKRLAEDSAQYLHHDHAQTFIYESGRFLMRIGERRFVRQVMAKFGDQKEAEVLDIGSGPGWVTTGIARAKPEWSVTGLDASPEMLKHAADLSSRKKIPVEWVRGFADKTGLPEEKFSLVVSSLAFHEFPDGRAAIQEMLRVLKKGGQIFIADLVRPSSLGFFYYRCIAPFIAPFSAAFRDQFYASLKSAYNINEIRTIVEEMGLSYTLEEQSHFGTRIFALTIRKA